MNVQDEETQKKREGENAVLSEILSDYRNGVIFRRQAFKVSWMFIIIEQEGKRMRIFILFFIHFSLGIQLLQHFLSLFTAYVSLCEFTFFFKAKKCR